MHTISIENQNRILLTDAAMECPVLWTQQEALVDQNQAILVVRPGQALGNLRAQLGLPTVDIPICQSLITRSRTCRLELPSGRLAVHLERETSGGKPELLLEVPPGSYSARIDLIQWPDDAIMDAADLTGKSVAYKL